MFRCLRCQAFFIEKNCALFLAKKTSLHCLKQPPFLIHRDGVQWTTIPALRGRSIVHSHVNMHRLVEAQLVFSLLTFVLDLVNRRARVSISSPRKLGRSHPLRAESPSQQSFSETPSPRDSVTRKEYGYRGKGLTFATIVSCGFHDMIKLSSYY